MMIQQTNILIHFAGISALIGNFIAFLVGGLILAKYFETKDKRVFLMFLTVVFTISAGVPSAVSYLSWILTGNFLSYEAYVLIGMIGVPIAPLAWLDIYLMSVHPNRRKQLLMIFIIFTIIFEVYLFYFTLFAPVAWREIYIAVYIAEDIDITYKGFIMMFLGVSLLLAIFTGIHFSIISMRSDIKELQIKGKFLLLGFVFMAIGIPADTILPLDPILIVTFRIVLIGSTICFYIGFIMPKWAKKRFLKETEPKLD